MVDTPWPFGGQRPSSFRCSARTNIEDLTDDEVKEFARAVYQLDLAEVYESQKTSVEDLVCGPHCEEVMD